MSLLFHSLIFFSGYRVAVTQQTLKVTTVRNWSKEKTGTYPVSESHLEAFLFELGTRLHHSCEKKKYMLYNQLKFKLWLSPIIVFNTMYFSNTHSTL